MWEITWTSYHSSTLSELLKAGWVPFSVTLNVSETDYWIWLRRVKQTQGEDGGKSTD